MSPCSFPMTITITPRAPYISKNDSHELYNNANQTEGKLLANCNDRIFMLANLLYILVVTRQYVKLFDSCCNSFMILMLLSKS